MIFQTDQPYRSSSCNSVCLPPDNPRIFRTVFQDEDEDRNGEDKFINLTNNVEDKMVNIFTLFTKTLIIIILKSRSRKLSKLTMRRPNRKEVGCTQKLTGK